MNHIEDRNMVPIERFRNILGCLEIPESSSGERYWLRFAAQAALLRPESPDHIAALIRRTAQTLSDNTAWYEDLSSDMRFVIAAILVQTHDNPCEFIKAHRHLGNLLRQQQLRGGGKHETLAICILRMCADKRRIHHQDLSRFKAIYEEMKNYHWWLTGPDDFPAAAALHHVAGSAREVIQKTERFYQYLSDAGFEEGDGLQSAVNLLPLLPQNPSDAVTKLIGLRKILKASGNDSIAYHYDSLIPLVMLEQSTQQIMDMTLSIHKELEICTEQHFGASTFGIAADLCFLDLIRYDKDLKNREGSDTLQDMLSDIHKFHIITTACISHFSPAAEGVYVQDSYDGWYI